MSQYPDDLASYLRLNVEVDGFLPSDAYQDALSLTNAKRGKFCCINAKRKESAQTEARTLTVQEFQSEEPAEIVKRYFEDSGIGFDDELEEIFKEALVLIQDEARK